MRKAEIARKFDEIVAFSEIGKFLDTPVKRYSSGMYMRLAFAVAAHLEPEILIIDEVLAVGDAAFQKKCLGKMGDVASQGRTVLFVSHNMTAVQGLCDRVIWLQDGKIREDGSTGQVVSHYLQTTFSALTQQTWESVEEAPGNDWVRLHQAIVRPVNGSPSDPITVRTPFLIEFHYWSLQAGVNLVLSLHLYNEQGLIVFNVGADNSPNWSEQPLPAGLFQDVCHVPGDFLNDGMYRVELCVCRGYEVIFKLDDILVFEVHDSTELRGAWFGKWVGVVRPALEWSSDLIEAALPAPSAQERST
jgi:homopolymeric O-antigen transport system ATP-binding protein